MRLKNLVGPVTRVKKRKQSHDCRGLTVDSLCFSTLRALLTDTKVESGDVSKQKWNLC